MWRKKRFTPKSDAELRQALRDLPVERGDLPAMLIAALATLLPVALLVGGAFTLFIWLLFLR